MDETGGSSWTYAGFWSRTGAMLIDSILVAIVTAPFLIWIYGIDYYAIDIDPDGSIGPMYKGLTDFVISFVLPAIAIVLFWIRWQATPGKMVISARIVDARTGGKPSTMQYIGRYLAYIPSGLPLGVGLLWVAFDSRKQGWHDKLARTVVIRRDVPAEWTWPLEDSRTSVGPS